MYLYVRNGLRYYTVKFVALYIYKNDKNENYILPLTFLQLGKKMSPITIINCLKLPLCSHDQIL